MTAKKNKIGGMGAEEAVEVAEQVAACEHSTPDEKPAEQPVATAETPTVYVYVGPTLPGGMLKENKMFIGTREVVLKELASVTDRYAEVQRLLVPVDGLASAKKQVKDKGTLLGHSYLQLEVKLKK